MSAKPGTEHHYAKLNPNLVRQIRKLRRLGVSTVKIAEHLDWLVGETAVRAVVNGTTWSHVEDDPEDVE